MKITATKNFVTFLNVPVYDCDVKLMVGDPKYINDFFKTSPDWEVFKSDGLEMGRCYWFGRSYFVILDGKKITLRLALHECYHLTNAILDGNGCYYGPDHDEHGALLHEYLTGWVLDVLKREGRL